MLHNRLEIIQDFDIIEVLFPIKLTDAGLLQVLRI